MTLHGKRMSSPNNASTRKMVILRRILLIVKGEQLISVKIIISLSLSQRPKQGANFAWGQQRGAWGRAGNANLLGVKATLLGVNQIAQATLLDQSNC